jgi:integrase
MNINTLRKILVTLGQILSYAVRHRYLDHNPLRDAERPREKGIEGERAQERVSILTPNQINGLLDAVKGVIEERLKKEAPKKTDVNRIKIQEKKYRTLFMLAVFTGARQGELLGLKWGDIDWESKQIHIQRTYTKGQFFATKTRSSNRRVDLGPKVSTELKKWKLACPKSDLDLVFPNGLGKPMNYSNMMNRYFKPALKKASLPKIRFHDLRHTYASLLIEQGENLKYIQSQLGHSTPTVTLNVYSHLMNPTNQGAALRLESAVFGGDGSKMVAKPKKEVTARTVTP